MNEKVGSTFGFTSVDRLPVMHGGAAERIHAELQTGAPDGVHVDDVFQVVDIG